MPHPTYLNDGAGNNYGPDDIDHSQVVNGVQLFYDKQHRIVAFEYVEEPEP